MKNHLLLLFLLSFLVSELVCAKAGSIEAVLNQTANIKNKELILRNESLRIVPPKNPAIVE